MHGSIYYGMFAQYAGEFFPIEPRYGSFVQELVTFNYNNFTYSVIEQNKLRYIDKENDPEFFSENGPFEGMNNVGVMSAADPDKIILKGTLEQNGS